MDCLPFDLKHLSATLFHMHYSYRLSREVSDEDFPRDPSDMETKTCTWPTSGSVLQLMRHLSRQLQTATPRRDSKESYKKGHLQGRIYDFNGFLLNTVKQRSIYSFISGQNFSKANTRSLIASLCERRLSLLWLN